MRHPSRVNTSPSRVVREAVTCEPDAGRYVDIRRRRPECLERVDALADKHGIDRDSRPGWGPTAPLRGRRVMQNTGVHIKSIHNRRGETYAQIDRACAIAQTLGRGKLVLVEPARRRMIATSCAPRWSRARLQEGARSR